MRYRVRVLRGQKADRVVSAVDEDDAIKKVREELDKPYGYLGRWETVSTEVEILAEEPALSTAPPPLGESALMLPLKDAARHLGVSYGSLYELVNRGEIDHVRLGRRMYIARDALQRFIEANTHRGYWRP